MFRLLTLFTRITTTYNKSHLNNFNQLICTVVSVSTRLIISESCSYFFRIMFMFLYEGFQKILHNIANKSWKQHPERSWTAFQKNPEKDADINLKRIPEYNSNIILNKNIIQSYLFYDKSLLLPPIMAIARNRNVISSVLSVLDSVPAGNSTTNRLVFIV